MPTAPILVDRITALVRQDTVAMEKTAKVGEIIYLANLKVSYIAVVVTSKNGGFLELFLVIFVFNLDYKLPPPRRISKSQKLDKMSEGRLHHGRTRWMDRMSGVPIDCFCKISVRRSKYCLKLFLFFEEG